VFQVGKSREGERKFGMAAFGRLPWKYIRINCRIIFQWTENKYYVEEYYRIQSGFSGKYSLVPTGLV
jgi:hypothetical protein